MWHFEVETIKQYFPVKCTSMIFVKKKTIFLHNFPSVEAPKSYHSKTLCIQGSFHLSLKKNTWFLHAIYHNVRQPMGLEQILGVSTWQSILDSTLFTLTILSSGVCASLEGLNNSPHQLSALKLSL